MRGVVEQQGDQITRLNRAKCRDADFGIGRALDLQRERIARTRTPHSGGSISEYQSSVESDPAVEGAADSERNRFETITGNFGRFNDALNRRFVIAIIAA